MCAQCDELKERLKEEQMKKRVTPKYWWAGLVGTIIIFIITTIYASGKISNQIEEHIKVDPTFKEMIQEFVTRQEWNNRKEEVNSDLKEMKEMLQYLYRKEGGK